MVSSNWLTTFRGRLGFVNGSWLGYVTGGVAVANVSSTDLFIGRHGAVRSMGHGSSPRRRDVGTGVEWAFAPLEYLYVDLATPVIAIGMLARSSTTITG